MSKLFTAAGRRRRRVLSSHRSLCYLGQSRFAPPVAPGCRRSAQQRWEGKQDCERNTAKRLVARVCQEHPRLPLVVVGHGLYCRETCIVQLRAEGLRHVLGCQPVSHLTLYQGVEEVAALGECEHGT